MRPLERNRLRAPDSTSSASHDALWLHSLALSLVPMFFSLPLFGMMDPLDLVVAPKANSWAAS